MDSKCVAKANDDNVVENCQGSFQANRKTIKFMAVKPKRLDQIKSKDSNKSRSNKTQTCRDQTYIDQTCRDQTINDQEMPPRQTLK